MNKCTTKKQGMWDLGQHANTTVKYYNAGMARYCKQKTKQIQKRHKLQQHNTNK